MILGKFSLRNSSFRDRGVSAISSSLRYSQMQENAVAINQNHTPNALVVMLDILVNGKEFKQYPRMNYYSAQLRSSSTANYESCALLKWELLL